jgi:hypothetical protein
MRKLQNVVLPPTPQVQVTGAPQAGRWMQTVHSDVTMPFQAAAITGALVTALLLLLVGGVIYWQRVPFVDALPGLVLGGAVLWLTTTLVAWFDERRAIRATWWRAEERDQVDYTGDGQIGRPEAMQVRVAGDAERKSAEDLMQQRLEEFISRLYNAEKRTTPVIRRLGFTERERTDFVRELRAARLIESERGGNAAAWRWVYDDSQKTIGLARKRIMWRIPGGSQ